MTKAILIDVENKEIKNVEIEEGIQDIYQNLNCQCFSVVSIDKNTDCFVDDESLLKQGYIDDDGTRHNLSGFKMGEMNLIMGNGLLVGSPDFDGNTTDVKVPLVIVEMAVKFVDFDNNDDKPQPFMSFSAWEF